MSLTVIQNYFLQRNSLGIYTCFLVGAQLASAVPQMELEQALQKLIGQRRALRLAVIGGEVQEIEINAANSIGFVGEEEDFVNVLSSIHETVFPIDGRGWKIFVSGRWIIYACNHVFADGTTAALVIEDLVTILNGGTLVDDVDANEAYTEKTTPSWSVLINTISKKLWNDFWNPKTDGPPFVPPESFKTQKFILQIDNDDFKQIQKVTKREGITFTELLLALNYIALQPLGQEPQLDFILPVNQRRSLGHPRAYGAYVSGVDFAIPRSIKTWEELKDHISIKDSRLALSSQHVGLLKYVSVESYIKEKAAAGRVSNALEISNLGRRGRLIEGAYSVDQYIFSQPLVATSDHFSISLISSDTMTNAVISASPDEPLFEQYKSNITRLIKTVVDNSAAELSIDDLRHSLLS